MEAQRPPLPSMAIDPVTGASFSPKDRTPRVFYRGLCFYFLAFETRMTFKQDPDKYMALRPEAGVPVSVQVRRAGPFSILNNRPDSGDADD
jgi:YHS domain-containing protein